MNILLLGATGRVGASVIEFALAGQHQVTAIARNRAKIQLIDSHLTVVEGDIYKPETLIAPMSQQIDVVINVVGGDVFKPSTVVTDSVKAALSAIQHTGVTRYLGITGVAEMHPCGPLGTITTTAIAHSPIRHAVHDHDTAFALVKQSDINWVLAGCPYIRDGKHTAHYTLQPECFPGGFKTISPQDVADFLVKEATAQRYSKQVVGIWN